MTRIEQENNQNNQLEEMQKEIGNLKKELKHKQSKKFLSCRNCSIILIVVFLVVAVLGAVALAQSGLITVPLVGNYLYKTPQPVYGVKAISFGQTGFLSRLQQRVGAAYLSQRKFTNLEVNLDLSEEELTALLKEQLVKNSSLNQNIESWQIAIKPDYSQLYVVLKAPVKAIVTLDFVPLAKDGKLVLQVKSFKLGNLGLPKFIGSLLIENLGASTLNSALASLSAAGKIEAITLADRQINVKLLLSNFKP